MQSPWRLLETRAVTPAPSDVGQSQIHDYPWRVPAMSCAAFMGVDMPTVPVGEAIYPVLDHERDRWNTCPRMRRKPRPLARFTADVLSPRRLQASFFYSREDRARFAGMDEALSIEPIRRPV